MTPTPEQLAATAARLQKRTAERKAAGLIPAEYAVTPAKPAAGLSPRETPRSNNVRRPLPCVSLGPKIDPACHCTDRTCLAGKGTVRHLAECQACDGYEPAARPGMFAMPTPPRLDLTPTSPLAVVTVAAGPPGRELLALSRPALEAYARRVGADFVVLDWECPGWPMGSKYGIYRTLEHYERVAYFDADVMLPAGYPDLFALCPATHFGAVDELARHRGREKYGVERSYLRLRRTLGFKPLDKAPWYVNCGVFVAGRAHLPVLMPPREIPATHLAEQEMTNARLLDSETPVHFLPDDCNRQWWWEGGFPADTSPRAARHFSGMKHADRVREMTRADLPSVALPLPPETWAAAFEPLRGKRIKLITMPNGNVGDVLLEVAARKLLTHFGVTEDADRPDVLLVAPGGNMGGVLNPDARAARESAVASGLPVVVLPQSWFGFEDVPYYACFARERDSLRYEPRAELAPDLALCLTPDDFGVRDLPAGSGRGVWLRQDGEALFRDRPSMGDPAYVCRTPAEYLRLAASFEEIVTDRLHFAICGLIAGRRVTLLPGSYHKNRAVWEMSLKAIGCGWADGPGAG